MDDNDPSLQSVLSACESLHSVFCVMMKYRFLIILAFSLIFFGNRSVCSQTPILPGEPQTKNQPVQESLGDAPGELKQDDQKPPVTALGTDLDKWPLQSIDQISLDIRDKAKVVPRDRSGLLINESKSNWNDFYPTEKDFAWCPADISYQPLYCQDVAIERYGQTLHCPGVQEALCGVHFFASVMTLPCQVLRDSPFGCEYPLGYCRPGNPAPCTHQKYLFWCR